MNFTKFLREVDIENIDLLISIKYVCYEIRKYRKVRKTVKRSDINPCCSIAIYRETYRANFLLMIDRRILAAALISEISLQFVMSDFLTAFKYRCDQA